MPDAPADIDGLIALMARLPGLGPRSARRAVLHLVKKRATLLLPLAHAMREVGETARECVACGNIGTGDLCAICADDRRAQGQICVVEGVEDLWAMERTGAFRGRYHVLGGTLSALDSVGPDELGIPRLAARVADEAVTEVILALGATVDGQTTAHYIADRLAGVARGVSAGVPAGVAGGVPAGVVVTTLAQGVPVGGELDYLDEGTIGAALRARRPL